MKHLTHILLLTSLLVMAGPAHAGSDEAGSRESMSRQWHETMTALEAYSAEQRDKALEAGRKTLEAMDRRLDKMETWTQTHWDALSAQARQERKEMLTALRRQRNEVAEWYGGMKHSSADAWGDVRQGFIESYDKLQNAYSDAVESLQSDEQG